MVAVERGACTGLIHLRWIWPGSLVYAPKLSRLGEFRCSPDVLKTVDHELSLLCIHDDVVDLDPKSKVVPSPQLVDCT